MIVVYLKRFVSVVSALSTGTPVMPEREISKEYDVVDEMIMKPLQAIKIWIMNLPRPP